MIKYIFVNFLYIYIFKCIYYIQTIKNNIVKSCVFGVSKDMNRCYKTNNVLCESVRIVPNEIYFMPRRRHYICHQTLKIKKVLKSGKIRLIEYLIVLLKF